MSYIERIATSSLYSMFKCTLPIYVCCESYIGAAGLPLWTLHGSGMKYPIHQNHNQQTCISPYYHWVHPVKISHTQFYSETFYPFVFSNHHFRTVCCLLTLCAEYSSIYWYNSLISLNHNNKQCVQCVHCASSFLAELSESKSNS